jgi:hypothetical protein
LDEALGLAVGFWRVGFGFDVFEAELIAGLAKGSREIFVSMVKASPTSPDARDAEPGLALSTRLEAYRATAPQVGCRGPLAAALVGQFLVLN